MWRDYYFKFADEAEYVEVVPEHLRYADSDTHSTVVIGAIYRADTLTLTPGYHVNMRLRDGQGLPDELEVYRLPVPELPKHRFA